MSEEKKTNKADSKKSEIPGKPKFNSNWIWGLLAIGFLAINFLNTGNTVKKIDRKSVV